MDQITVGGVSTYDDLGLIVLASSVLEPPEPLAYVEEVPGSDAALDYTEADGDAHYGRRRQRFDLFAPVRGRADAEARKTRLSALWHNRRLAYSLSWDPGYEYRGRWSLSGYEACEDGLTVSVEVDADPYKSAGRTVLVVNAAGGVDVSVPNGRRRARPTLHVNRPALVSHKGRSWELAPGDWRIRELWLDPGPNVLTVNTRPGYGPATWAASASSAWAALAGRTWAAVAAGGAPLQEPDAWADHAGRRWAELSARQWQELAHLAEESDEDAVYIEYERMDL